MPQIRGFASGRVKLDRQGRVTVSGHVIHWYGLEAEAEPFRTYIPPHTDYRRMRRRKDYYDIATPLAPPRVVPIDVFELCAHLRPWTGPCSDCGRGRG